MDVSGDWLSTAEVEARITKRVDKATICFTKESSIKIESLRVLNSRGAY
jgi:hypothetical protein